MKLRCPACHKHCDFTMVPPSSWLYRYCCSSCHTVSKAGDFGRAFVPGSEDKRRVKIVAPARVRIIGPEPARVRVTAKTSPLRVRIRPNSPRQP